MMMPMDADFAKPFDLGGLYRATDQERSRRGLTWAAVAREVGVAATTLRRFAHADDAEADGVLALVRWLGVAPEEFVAGSEVVGEPLSPAGEWMVRVDMTRVSAGGHVGGRTSVQRLVALAQAAGRPVASFTRESES